METKLVQVSKHIKAYNQLAFRAQQANGMKAAVMAAITARQVSQVFKII